MSELAVDTEHLTKEFLPGVGAIDLDLDVPRGQVYGFLGPNGAGKSTTIRMLTGSLVPDRGSAGVLGLDPLADRVEVQRRIGVVPSDAAFPAHHTGRTLVRLVGGLRGDVAGFTLAAAELAERLELDLGRTARDLSLGNRQKLAIVLALAHRPELVIMDEPTNGLDPLMQRELDLVIRELAAEGRTVLLSSHSLAEVERVADLVGFIREGRLVEQSPLADLVERAVRRATFTFHEPVPAEAFDGLPEVTEVLAAGDAVTITHRGAVARVLARASELGAVTVSGSGADLEATFLALYRESDVAPPDGGPDGEVA